MNMTEEEVPWYFREEITRTYESWYEGKYKRADLLEKALLKKLIDWIGDVRSLLEVGCGTAHFTRWFEENGIDCYGIDLSPLMLREARRLWRSGKLAQGISDFIPIKSASVDAVAFITCMEYMPDPIRVLKEARRVARRGILIGLMNSWSLPTIRRKIQVRLGRNPYYRNAHFYSIYTMKAILEKALDSEGYQIFHKSTVFPKAIPVKESRLPFGGFLGIGVKLGDGGKIS